MTTIEARIKEIKERIEIIDFEQAHLTWAEQSVIILNSRSDIEFLVKALEIALKDIDVRIKHETLEEIEKLFENKK